MYEEFWRIYRDAWAKADATRLSRLMTGEQWPKVVARIEEPKQRGRGVDIQLTTESLIFIPVRDQAYAGEEGFNVQHDYDDSSRWIDLKTGRTLPRTSPPAPTTHLTYFRKVGGEYRVIFTNRQPRDS